MLNLDQRATPNPGVVGQLLSDEAVLLLPARGQVKVLNDVGTRIWSLLDGVRSLREIAAIIHTEYDCEQQQVEQDVMRFVSDLEQRDMITLGHAHP